MDPVHGEISRAMRNRGLEIYISGEEDGSTLDNLDLKVLLHSLGLVGDSVCNILLALHTGVQSLVRGEVPDFWASAVLVLYLLMFPVVLECSHLVYIEIKVIRNTC